MPQLGLCDSGAVAATKCSPAVPRRAKVCRRRCRVYYADHAGDAGAAVFFIAAGLSIVCYRFLTLLAIGGVFFLIALLRFRKRWHNGVNIIAGWRLRSSGLQTAERACGVGGQAKRPGVSLLSANTASGRGAHAALGDNIIGKEVAYVAHISPFRTAISRRSSWLIWTLRGVATDKS